jgi:sirohydrochlorin ferrochelatase
VTRSLVLAAHGSADPRFALVIDELASRVAAARPPLGVRIGYLDHSSPALRDVVDAQCVVVPVFLSRGFHVQTDVPAQAPGSIITAAVGPDRRLAGVLANRLRAAGWQSEHPVALAAAGSEDPQALAEVRLAARDLGVELGVEVTAAFLSAGEPRLADLAPAAVATYLLAPGYFADVAAACGAPIVAAPLGADPQIAAIILDRYDDAVLGLSQEVRP